MSSKYSLIIDFDSTILSVESLEFVATISLKKKSNKNSILEKINHITNKAMNGEISFQESISKRLNLMDVKESHIKNAADKLINKLDKSFLDNLDFFKKNFNDVFIISGGFKKMINRILKQKTNIDWQIFGNELKFDKQTNKASINTNNPLAFSKGKLKIIKNLNLKNDIIVIGDGYTDYEIKKYGLAKYFIAYTNHVSRDTVIKNADIECDNFNKVIDFLNSNY